MNSTILKNGVTIFNIFMASTFIFWTIGCQSDDELESVNNSSVVACTSELEDFIIAATDLQQSLIVFEKELIKVNFADLETEINADGNKVTHLPAIIRSLNIEQKILLMNQKKDALRNKYPQFASMDFNEIAKNIDYCIDNSMRISEFFDDKNINIHLQTTRSFFNESYNNMNELVGHLYNWALSSDYVEVHILTFSDGTYTVVEPSGNTAHSASLYGLMLDTTNKKYYYNGNQVVAIAHTHRNSSNPSQTDLDNRLPYCENAIYYNGSFNSF